MTQPNKNASSRLAFALFYKWLIADELFINTGIGGVDNQKVSVRIAIT